MADSQKTHDPHKIQEATERVERFLNMNWGECQCGDTDCPGWADESMEIVRIVLSTMTPEVKISE